MNASDIFGLGRIVLLAGCALWAIDSRAAAAPSAAGPFDAPSTLPYQLPAFGEIRETDYGPAFAVAFARQRAEVDAIANDPREPSFENTIVALERSGQMLARVGSTFANLTKSSTNPEHDALDLQISPRLAAQRDAILLNAALFARVRAVYDQRAGLDLDPESQRLLERCYRQFVRAGADLGEDAQRRLRSINEELWLRATQFSQALLKADNEGAIIVEHASELDGLSADQIDAAAQAARERGLAGKWVLALQNTTGQAALTSLRNRALRERIYRASVGRARAGANDTRPIIVRVARLRAEKAALLGYANWAAYVLADEMAQTPAAVNQMLAQMAAPAMEQARRMAAQLQGLIDEERAAEHQGSFRLEPWDWSFYADRLRKERYAFDEAQVRPYLELDRVRQDGLFYAAREFYGLHFRERKDLVSYRADVPIFEVLDADGSPLGLLLTDDFARANKRGGAWDDEYVRPSGLLGQQAVVANNLNMPRPAAGQPALMDFDDVNGMFHEFGHALHAIFSQVRYPMLAGTRVPRDFVEYPSQFNEMWSRDPQVVAHMARHFRTGAAMPPQLLERVLAAQRCNSAFETLEYLAAAVLDQAWHQITADEVPPADGVAAFEAAALARAGLDLPAVPPRYSSPYFAHLFGDEYAASYYSYLWSNVLAKDTEQWTKLHGGLQHANGSFLRAKVLARGSSAEPGRLFREFYGREPDVEPLLEFLGLRAPPADPPRRRADDPTIPTGP